jgi:hypothetical protein
LAKVNVPDAVVVELNWPVKENVPEELIWLLVMLPGPFWVMVMVPEAPQEGAEKSVVNLNVDHWVLSPDTVKLIGWERLVIPFHWPGIGVGTGVLVAVKVGVGVSVAVGVGVSVWVGVNVLVGVSVAVGVGVSVCVGVNVPVGVSVNVAVGVLVNVAVGVGVWVKVGVAVGVGVSVGVGVDVRVCVAVRVGVRVLVRVDVRVDVKRRVLVIVGEEAEEKSLRTRGMNNWLRPLPLSEAANGLPAGKIARSNASPSKRHPNQMMVVRVLFIMFLPTFLRMQRSSSDTYKDVLEGILALDIPINSR